MTNAVSGKIAGGTPGLAHKAMTEHRDLTGACIAGIVGAILMRFATLAGHPGLVHAALAVVSVAAIVSGFLLLARSAVAAEWKLAALAGTSIIAALCFRLLTMLAA